MFIRMHFKLQFVYCLFPFGQNILGNMILSIQRSFYAKTIEINQSIWQIAAILEPQLFFFFFFFLLLRHHWYFFYEVWMRWFFAWNRMKVYMINFYYHYSVCGPTLVAGGILFRQQVFVPFSFFLYTFWSLSVFCWKTNMVGLDFWDTQSS